MIEASVWSCLYENEKFAPQWTDVFAEHISNLYPICPLSCKSHRFGVRYFLKCMAKCLMNGILFPILFRSCCLMTVFQTGCPVVFHFGRCYPPCRDEDVIIYYARVNNVDHEPGLLAARYVKGRERINPFK